MSSPLSVKKNNYIKNPKRSDIETPLEIAEFIASLFDRDSVFDPCSGNGNLLKLFKERGYKIESCEIKSGCDFLKRKEKIDAELIVCNPPFNLGVGKKLGSEVFLKKILELWRKDAAIVLFVPMGFRLNQRKTSKRWRWLRDSCPPITSIISLPLDIFENVAFHSEILIFNAPALKPHYFIPS